MRLAELKTKYNGDVAIAPTKCIVTSDQNGDVGLVHNGSDCRYWVLDMTYDDAVIEINQAFKGVNNGNA